MIPTVAEHSDELKPICLRYSVQRLDLFGSAAARISFAEASALVSELAGVRVGAKQVERAAKALGREIAAAEGEERGLEPEPAAAATMYLGMDGTGVPVRKAETAGRAGKQPDGSAKTREVKLVLV